LVLRGKPFWSTVGKQLYGNLPRGLEFGATVGCSFGEFFRRFRGFRLLGLAGTTENPGQVGGADIQVETYVKEITGPVRPKQDRIEGVG